MADLIEIIREKKSEIARLRGELEQALAELTSADQFVEAARAIRTEKAKRRAGGTAHGNGGPPEIIATSSMGRAVEVMRQNGRPLHVDEIIRRIEAAGHKVKKTTLVGNLSRYNAAKRVVFRPKPSFYGLLEWRK